ncbi:M20 metallopeptidase family protein [Pseudobacillus wudalianchiensis]|uniref:Amidohydrolase n=1 Tax=Pseudobacillus wudalianchiensis TaxID=1743143 RepID=A0A1B9AXM4_9BACI|nr:M20 family metallopeptidase [Bacillus wudalianchiensis]OCA88735.1 amidohydrolase [Bacillus wudalianchiensis]
MSHSLIKVKSDQVEEVIQIRRHLHQHPELSFQEYKTAEYIKSILQNWGIPYQSIGETGVIVDIVGKEGGRAIGLRADIDALPIHEQTDLPYRSQYNHVMHACGHDGHTAILLGAVYELNQIKEQLSGTVRCIFQPGEEADGAAKALIEQGALSNPEIEAMTGLHLWPHLPLGTVGIKYGGMTASCDDFKITITGKGGHSARPHQAIDAIAIAASMIQAFQSLTVKRFNPGEPVIIHIGKINGGEASNIVASTVVLEGTARAVNNSLRGEIYQEILKVCRAAEVQWEAQIEVDYTLGHPPIVNDEQMTNQFEEMASRLLGAERVISLKEPSMGADDFGYFSAKVPSIYFRLGIQKENQPVYDLHHPKFQFDDSILRTGIELYVNFALSLLQDRREQ